MLNLIVIDESFDVVQLIGSTGVTFVERLKKPRVPSGPEGILVTFSGTCIIAILLLLLDR